jgi:cell division protein FtsB
MADSKYNILLTASDETLAAFQSVKRGFGEVTAGGDALKAIFAGLSTGAMVEFAKSGIDAVNQLHELSIKANASVESLSAMRLSAAETGTSMDSVATAIAKLNKSIGEAQVIGGPKADLLKTLGIDISVGRDAGLILFDLSKKLADMSDKQAATYVTSQLMARGYTELAPFLEKLAQQESLVAEVTTKQSDEANKLSDRIVTLTHNIRLMAEDPHLVNQLNDITTAMLQAEKESGVLAAIWAGMGGAAAHILGVDDASEVKKRIDDLTQSLSVAQKQLDAGSLKPGGTGKSFFSFLVPDIQLSDQALNTLRENIAGMKAELLGLRSGQDYVAPAAAKGEDASAAILNAKKIAEAQATAQKIIDIATREDAATTASHEDAFFKWLDGWKKTEDKLTELGAAGTAARKLHEAAYTVYVNDENTKRNAGAAAADAVKAAHLASELINENAYFARLHALAEDADTTNIGREKLRYDRELADWNKRYADAKKRDDFSLAEEAKFQQAKLDLDTAHEVARQALHDDSDRKIVDGQIQWQKISLDSMSSSFGLMKGLMNSHSHAAFEIGKAAAISETMINTYKSATESYAAMASIPYVGPALGAAAAAAAIVAGLAQVSAIESTSFGGGGSGGGSSYGGATSALNGGQVTTNYPSVPAAPAAPLGVAPSTTTVNLTIIGAKNNPDAPLISYNSFVNDFIPLMQTAKNNGHLVDFNVTAG